MKTKYESPLMVVEMFAANQAIAGCTANSNVNFDCLVGTEKDTANVLAAALSCKVNAEYFPEADSAYNDSRDHSEYNSNLDWSKWDSSHTVYAKNDPSGMLCICAANMNHNGTNDYSTNGWTLDGSTVSHSNNRFASTSHNCTHAMVAPVYGSVTGINVGS